MSFIPMRVSVGTISSVTGTTGTGAAGRVAYWQDATTLTSSASFTFDGTTMTAPGLIARNDTNGATRIQIRNDDAGASAFTQLKLTTDAGDINLTANSTAAGDSVSLTADSTFGGGMDVGILGANNLRLRTAGAARLTINGTGDATFSGSLSVEAGTGADTMFRVRGNSQTTGTVQVGALFDTIFSSGATSGVFGVSSTPQLANAAFTCGYAFAFSAGNITPLGGTATLTRAIGYFVNAQTNATNNANIADNTTFTGDWFINSTSTRASLFSGSVQITTDGNLPLALTGNSSAGTVRFINPAASTKYNWLIGGQFNINNTFEITPSTAVDGSTFSAPVFQCEASTGLITIGPNAGGVTHRFNTNTQTTVGAAGAASALPANPTGYWLLNINGTVRAIPYYANA